MSSDVIPGNFLAYLATPYTLVGDRAHAHWEACRIAGQLMRSGVHLFCPIAHSELIAAFGKIDPLDCEFWLHQNQKILERCDVLIVVNMPGFETSKGIAHEVAYFEKVARPIFDLDPANLRMIKRKRAVIRERYEDMKPEEFRQQANEYLEQ